MKHHIRTWGGRYFDFIDPRAEAVDIKDIATALSRICRYGGHLEQHYSVAQHSVLVSIYCDPVHRLAGLLHDAAEAYVGDVVGPLKHLPELAGFLAVEDRVHRVIMGKFGCDPVIPACVVLADQRAYVSEVRDLQHRVPEAFRDLPPFAEPIVPVPAGQAREMFIRRFHKLHRG